VLAVQGQKQSGYFLPPPDELPPAGGLLGWSPITVFSGHTLNAGHFWQPATTAMGHSVMTSLL
jgi:hypothetical protein